MGYVLPMNLLQIGEYFKQNVIDIEFLYTVYSILVVIAIKIYLIFLNKEVYGTLLKQQYFIC